MRRLPCLALLLLPALGFADAPTGSVRLDVEVIDSATKQRLPCRVYITNDKGDWFFPQTAAAAGSAVTYKRQRADHPPSVEMHTTLSAHPFFVDLVPGMYTLTIERGQEYLPETRQVLIGKEPVHLTIPLRRWISLAEQGWYSGETHVHRPVEDLPNIMLAEDLNVAFPLTYWVKDAFAPPRREKEIASRLIRVDDTHVIYPRNTEYEITVVGKKRHTLGAFFVIHHKSVFDKGVPPVAAVAEQAHAEGGLIELDKPNWPWSMMLVPVMKADLFELSNNHVWRTQFAFATFGEPAPDYMKVEKNARGFTEWGWLEFNFRNYYALLNCGFRLRPTAGTASGVHPVPLGFGRVYVHLKDGFDFDRWLKGLNAGRSFVSTGPMMFVQLDGQHPGHTFRQRDATGKDYRITGSLHAARPLRSIEIIVNGEVVRTVQPESQSKTEGGFTANLDATVPIAVSSWVAVRAFENRTDKRVRFCHSAPWHIDVPGSKVTPRREETDFLIARIEKEIDRNQDVLPVSALAEYREALRVYREIARTAR